MSGGGGCLAGCGLVLLTCGAGLFLFPLLLSFVPVFGPLVAIAAGVLANPLAWILMAVGGFLFILGAIFRDDD
jgi:hypothetical protein